jgi:HCOMODA/2-hydroxy-3-carboxy-muconic semialdehyde decarboxylase
MSTQSPPYTHGNAASPTRSAAKLTDADKALIDDLVAANRILFDQGVVDGFGHVSVRHNKRPQNFLLSRNMAPSLVAAADILEYDPEGEPVAANGPHVYLERFIHSEIFKARPDVVAVVHSHSPSVVPFGVVTGVPLRAVAHMSSFLGASTPIFEIRDTAGPANDMLIRSMELGAALARSLGTRPAVLMRGHGSTVVGTSLRQAVFRAVYTEVNAKLQAEALRLGPVTYLTDQEAEMSAATNATQINRAWDLWRSLAMPSSP